MKILHIITGIGQGGAETLLLPIVLELKKNGNIQKVVYLSSEDTLLPFFVKERVDVSKASGNALSQIFRLRKIIRDFEPDVIHTNLPRADFLGRIAGLTAARCRLVSTIHNCDPWKLRKTPISWILRSFNRITVNHVERVRLIAVSESVRRFCISTEKILEDKIVTIHNFVRAEFGKLEGRVERSELSIPDDAFLFVNVGRLAKQKNQIEILRAAQRIRERNVYFMILGEGEERNELEAYIAKEKLTNVRLVGAVDNVVNYLKISDMLLTTSIHEGIGIATLEALLTRLPVLASDIAPTVELNEYGCGLFTYKEGDTDALVSAIEHILSGNVDIHSSVEKAYDWVSSNTVQAYIEQLLKIYQ